MFKIPHDSTVIITNLSLSRSAGGELEVDVTTSQTTVDLGVGVQAVVNTTTLLLIENDLQSLAAILLGADALADDLNRVGEISQDSVVDGGEGSGARSLLLLVVARASRSLRAGQDAARSEDQNVAVRELLLELTGETFP